MKQVKYRSFLLCALLASTMLIAGCEKNGGIQWENIEEVDRSSLESEIEMELRKFENNLANGDSLSLGSMYMTDAMIMPSTVGRESIIKNFGRMIRDSITGSSFNTTGLWGNDRMLVEEGRGTWSHANGKVVGKGKYLVVWKKDSGQWKIFRDIWFPDKK